MVHGVGLEMGSVKDCKVYFAMRHPAMAARIVTITRYFDKRFKWQSEIALEMMKMLKDGLKHNFCFLHMAVGLPCVSFIFDFGRAQMVTLINEVSIGMLVKQSWQIDAKYFKQTFVS